jgi:membrane associated rhomboid family serine protease
MGLYDRDYYREERQGIGLALSSWSAVGTLIAINVGVFILDAFSNDHWLVVNMAAPVPQLVHEPWTWWRLVTYGFAHDPSDIWHLAFNMLGLWVFGRDVEAVYGRREFFKLYISLIILAGLVNVLIDLAAHNQTLLLGASGGVMGVAVIFACHFPRRMLLVIPIPIPIPAYLLVGFYVIGDFVASQLKTDHVAHWAHLGGAAFGFLYYKTGWNLFRLWPGSFKLRMPGRGPKFRIHRESDEEDADQPPPDDYLTTGRIQERVDQLLAKISREGESSLTDEERQFLQDASRRYQQQRRR